MIWSWALVEITGSVNHRYGAWTTPIREPYPLMAFDSPWKEPHSVPYITEEQAVCRDITNCSIFSKPRGRQIPRHNGKPNKTPTI